MSLLELPATRDEEWRWSDLSALPALVASPRHPIEQDYDAPGFGGPRLLFIDGEYRPDASNPGTIEIAPIAVATAHPLARLADRSGWRLHVDRDHAAAGTIELVHLSTGGANHLAAEIVLDEDAQASLVETFVGEGWVNRATTIRLARAARLMLARRILSRSGFASLIDRAEIAQGASLAGVTLAAGNGDSRIELHAALAGTGAFVETGGALLGRVGQRHDANVVLRHASPDGASHQTWRSVADERATASIAARVEVARGAQKTDAVQSLKGLLLARTATINLKPELEIFADDVKCAHGATVGEIDQAALFYLASRGLPPAEAKALLTRAFVGDALARIGDEAVRAAFERDADAWLGSQPPFTPGEGSAERRRGVEGHVSTSLAPNGVQDG